MEMNIVDIGKIVKDKREGKNLSHKELGKLAGVNHREIKEWEKGQSGPSLNDAIKILLALGLGLQLVKMPEPLP